jgi:hypothetical protein
VRAVVLLVIVAACAREGKPPVVERVAAAAEIDAGIDATDDANVDAPVGAVPLPDLAGPVPIEEIDTSIAVAELPTGLSGWQTTVSVPRGGRQLVALHVRDGKIVLSIVEDENGIVQAFPLEPIESMPQLHTIDGDAYAPRSYFGDYDGPILFAIRIRRTATDAWQQIVVYTDDSAIDVVERPLGDAVWERRLRVELEHGATPIAIGTTDPH